MVRLLNSEAELDLCRYEPIFSSMLLFYFNIILSFPRLILTTELKNKPTDS